KSASAARGSRRPSYSARPQITPAMPAAASALSAARSASPATPPEAMTGSPGERGDRLGVDTAERAVARDVGIDDRGDAGIGKAMRQLDRADLALLGPALDRDLAAATVDADDDPPGMGGGGAPDQIGLAQRRGAEHDAVDAEIEPGGDRGGVADAAAELDFDADGAADRPHRRAVDRCAGKGAVEIDDVEPGEAQSGKGARLRRRVV